MKIKFTILLMACLLAGYLNGWGQTTRYVPETAGNPGYSTIQAAISAASSGDVIQVSAGTYLQAQQLVIDKNLTLTGAGKATTFIKADLNLTGGSATDPALIKVNTGVTFNFSGFTVDGDFPAHQVRMGLITYGTGGTISDNNFINVSLAAGSYDGRGVVVYGTGVTVSNNTLSNIGRIGIMVRKAYYGTQVGSATVSGNTFMGKGEGLQLDYGIEVGAAASATLSGNNISNCKGVAYDNSTSAGILATDYYATGTTVTISGNTLNDNRVGIALGYGVNDATTASISGNTFTNHTINNLQYTANLNFDKNATFTGNTFDHCAVIKNGSGAITGSQFYVSIPDAVIDAAESDVIEMTSGTYNFTAQMNIDKAGLTITGQSGVIFKANNSSWSTVNGYKHLIGIYAGTETNPVTISNITMDCSSQCYGVNTYNNAYGVLSNVAINASKGAGLTVNGSTVIATDLNTATNAWGAVNVDPGSGVTTPSTFTLNSGTLAENTQIWSDGSYVTGSATVTVTATGYNKYTVGTTKIWTNRPLTNCATITKDGETTIYNTIQAAINAANDNDIIQIAAGTFTEALTVGKSLTFIGSGPSDNPTTIIKSTANPMVSLSSTGKNFSFQNLIIEGNVTNNGIRAGGSININSLTLEDVIARNCQVGLYLAEYYSGGVFVTTTVNSLSLDNVTLLNNKFIGAYIGKTVLSGTVANSTITGNGYSSELPDSWQKTGLQFVNFDEASVPQVTVTNSTFTNNGAGASNIERTGLIIYTAYNALSANEIMTVSGCSFTNHPLYAVRIKNGYNVGNKATVNGTFNNNYLDIWFNNVIGTTSSTSLVRRTFTGIRTVGSGPTYDYATIQAAINAASTGDVIEVAAGTYNENVIVSKSLTLKGANYNTACSSRSAESIVAPSAGLPISVTADGVSINGFEITAPAYQNAIVFGNRSNVSILYNKIHDIGTSVSGVNVHSVIYTVANGSNTQNIFISNNCFNNISSSSLTGYSAAAIGILQSTSTGVLNGLTIENNTINNVNVNTGNWPTGKLAYGIIINVGGSSSYQTTTGKVVSANVKNNTISNLTGFISTGIGLEGNTENAVIQNNTVSNLTGYKLSDRSGGGYDLNGLKFENNRFVNTVQVTDNVFNTNTFNYIDTPNLGYAVANYVPTNVGGNAEVTCNWFGTANANEINDNATLTGKVFNKEGCETNFNPFWISSTGPCTGGPIVVYQSDGTTFVSSHETIQAAIDAATTLSGYVISVPAGTYDYISEGSPAPSGLIKVTKGVTIKAAAGTRPIIDGSDFDGVFKIHPSALNPGNTVIIEGFEIIGNAATGIAMTMQGCFNVTPAKVIIRDNWFHGMVGGIDFWGAGAYLPSGWTSALANIEITNNKFYDMVTSGSDQGFGVMIEDPANYATAGNDYAVKVENNEFSNLPSNGSNPGVGIVIPRANDAWEAANVFISGNTFNNTVAVGVAFMDGDVTDAQVINNSFNNSVYGILASGIDNGPIDAECNWFGTTDYNTILTKVIGDVDFVNYLVSDNIVSPACTGDVWPVYNATHPKYFTTIQSAINDASTVTGDVITVAAGTYSEGTITISKSLDIRGAKYNVDPTNVSNGRTAGTVTGESVIVGPVLFNSNVSNVFFNGFYVDYNGTAVLGESVSTYLNNGVSNISISYNVYEDSDYNINVTPPWGIHKAIITSSTGSSNVSIASNLIAGYETAVYLNPAANNAVLNGNKVLNCKYGFRFISTQGLTVTNNTFEGSGGLQLRSGWSNPAPAISGLTITGNFFSNLPASILWVGYLDVQDNRLTVDVSNITFEGKLPSAMSLTELFALEDHIVHKLDNATKGLVTWIPGNLYVTTNSGSIQRGIDAATSGWQVNVNEGIFTEQLHITTNNLTIGGVSKSTVTVKAPASVPLYFTSGTNQNHPVIFVDGVNQFTMNNVTIDGDGKGNANYRFQGIGFWNSGGTLTNVDVYNIIDTPFSGAQHGVAVYAHNNTNGPYTVACTNMVIDDYQKNAMALSGTGLTIALDNITTIGAGPTSVTAQNGIQVAYGASGTITNSNVSGNNYSGSGWSSAGILLYQSGTVNISNTTVTDNYVGIDVNDCDGSISNSTVSNQNSESWDGIYLRKYQNTPMTFNVTGVTITGHGKTDSWGILVRANTGTITSSITQCQVSNWGLGVYTREIAPGVVNVLTNNNDISGNTDGYYANTTTAQDATNNYWGTCPSVTGPATYFPYWSTVSGTPGSFVFGGQIDNITASASENTICLGESVTLSAGNGSNFLWDNSLGLGATKLVIPATIGDHTYNVTGDDTQGCAGGFNSVTVTVVEAPTVAIGAQTVGGTTTLTASGASSYVWNTGFTGNPLVVSPTVTTEYTVIGTNSSGCTGSASHTVNVVTVTIGPDQYICEGSEVTLTATVNGATPTSYSWAPGGQTDNPITVYPVSNTEYTVSVNGSFTASVWVYVHPKPVANAGDDKILAGASVILNGSASGGTAPYTYAWTGPSGFTSSLQNPSVSANGTYSLVVTDAYGCSSNANDVDVTAPAANTYTVSGNVSYAFNQTNNQMHNVEVKLVGAQTYIGYTALSGNGDYVIPGVVDGTYTVYLSSPKPWGGVTSTDITLIGNHYRARNPIPLVGIKRLAADVVENSSAAEIDATDRAKVNSKRLNASIPFETGNWVFTKSVDINHAGPTYNYSHAGNTAFSNITIIVPESDLPNQNFSALCYGDVDASYTGLKVLEITGPNVADGTEQDWFELSNYPNPFAGQTTFSYYQPVEGDVTIQIFDMMGNLVRSVEKPAANEGQHDFLFNAAGFAPGVYLYVLTLATSDDTLMQTGKMIINK